MRFLKLLNPYDRPTNDLAGPGRQQKEAEQRFPGLVCDSHLNYWSPGDPIVKHGVRYLVGVAATYDLRDLRLCDIVNDRLKEWKPSDIRVDVFNAAACKSDEEFALYFTSVPDIPPGWHFTPLVGKWVDGEQVVAISGFEARRFILEELGCDITAEESVSGLCPPDPSLIED